MKFEKLSFVMGNFFGASVLGLVVISCGGGGGGSDLGTISASNIIFSTDSQNAGLPSGVIRVQANQLPSNIQVMASNVSIIKTKNSLKSTDLQSALDEEISVDMSKTIVGVWDVQNITSDSTYQGQWSTGKVEFKSDGSYIISNGGFGAAGKVASGTSSFCNIPTSSTYTLIDGAIYFGADSGGDSVAIVAKITSNGMTLIGDGGCGAQGIARISKLTRAGSQQTSYKAPFKSDKSNIIVTSF